MEEQELPSNSILCLSFVSTILGIAWFKEDTNEIFVDAITTSSETFVDIMFTLKSHTSPTLLLLHPKIVVNSQIFDVMISGLDSYTKLSYEVIKNSHWHFDSCLNIICSKLQVRDLDTSLPSKSFDARYRLLSSRIDFDNRHIVTTLGALISYLREKIFTLDEEIISVSSIETLQQEKYMKLDEETFRFV